MMRFDRPEIITLRKLEFVSESCFEKILESKVKNVQAFCNVKELCYLRARSL
eukprot:UN27259